MSKDTTTDVRVDVAEANPQPDVRLLRSLTLRNILSFGGNTPPLELRALNVLIGPNGSGKSNVLACLSLLPAMPTDLSAAFRQGGSTVRDWLRDSTSAPPATVGVTINLSRGGSIGHQVDFHTENYKVKLVRELVGVTSNAMLNWEAAHVSYEADFMPLEPVFLQDGKPSTTPLPVSEYGSVLAQLRDERAYPEFARLVSAYESISFFRDWSFGTISPIRQPQRADAPGNFLREGGENLALVLNQLRRDTEAKSQIVKALNELYDGIEDYETFVQGGYVELFLREGKQLISASRLSDGTLRYLCLLAILLHPTPPPLICLEEPELGLHPDAVLAVGKLIRDASERTQIIITTHSDILVDVLGEQPENIIVCEKHDGQTEMNRLSAQDLQVWLERYSLSQLWTRGKLGGNRW